MVHFGEFLKTWSLQSNSVTRQVNFNRTKVGGNTKIQKFKWDILGDFQTMWSGRKYTVFLSKSCLLEQRWYCEGFVRLLLLQWCIFWLPSCSCSGTICSVCQKKIVTRLGKKCYICRDCGLCCHKGCYDRTMNSCTKSTLESMEL